MANIDLSSFAVSILVLGIVAAIGAIVLTGFRDVAPTTAYTIYNETLPSNVSNAAYAYLKNPGCEGVSSCMNASNGANILPGNYTVSVPTDTSQMCGIKANYAALVHSWNCTYTGGNISSPAYDIANKAIIGVSEYQNWFKILVIVAVAALILGLIFLAFKPKDSSMGTY